jgi:hypothetical protein
LSDETQRQPAFSAPVGRRLNWKLRKRSIFDDNDIPVGIVLFDILISSSIITAAALLSRNGEQEREQLLMLLE